MPWVQLLIHTVWRLVPCPLSPPNSTPGQKSFHSLGFFLTLFSTLHSPREASIPAIRKEFSTTSTYRGPVRRDAAQKTTGLTDSTLKRWGGGGTQKAKELQPEQPLPSLIQSAQGQKCIGRGTFFFFWILEYFSIHKTILQELPSKPELHLCFIYTWRKFYTILGH